MVKIKNSNYITVLCLVLVFIYALLGLFETLFDVSTININFIMLFVYIIWNSTIEKRFINKNFKRYLFSFSGMIIFLIVVTMLKYQFFSPDTTAARYLWYMYYIPLLLMPLFAFLSVLFIGKDEEATISNKWKLLFIPQIILIILVLTNDLHELVFNLKPDAANWNGDYSYGFLYYIIVADIAVLFLLYISYVFIYSARKRYLYLYLSFLVVAVAIVYIVMFFTVEPSKNLFVSMFNMPIAVSLFSILFFESVVKAHLIPSNTLYGEFFNASSIRAGLCDNNFKTVLNASNRADVTPTEIKSSVDGEVIHSNDFSVRSHKVNGGYFFWMEDIKELNKVNAKLKETENYLNEENAILEATAKLEEKKRRTEQQTKLYDEINLKVKPQLNQVEEILSSINENEDEEEFRHKMKLASIYNAYIKRYTNLLLLAAQNDKTDIGEFKIAVAESLQYTSLCDITVFYDIPSGINVQSGLILTLYELFEAVIESSVPGADAVFVKLGFNGNRLEYYMEISNPRELFDEGEFNGVKVESSDITEYITFNAEVEDYVY